MCGSLTNSDIQCVAVSTCSTRFEHIQPPENNYRVAGPPDFSIEFTCSAYFYRINRRRANLKFNGERLPDALDGHVDDLPGLAVDAGRAGAGGVARAQRRQRADGVGPAVLGQRARDDLWKDEDMVTIPFIQT